MEIIHKPVLLRECLEFLSPEGEVFEEDALMIDSTLGEGGHSAAFLDKYNNLRIIGLDADSNIQARAKERLAVFGSRMDFHLGWFNDYYANFPVEQRRPDLILFDLGISVFHYECSKRGFSFRKDEPLDMRLSENTDICAADIVNGWSKEAIANLLYLYGEERYSRKIADAIIFARQNSKIENAADLADVVYRCVPASYRHGVIHPATKTFQALRIAVNKELSRLPKVLPDAFNVLKCGGKMGVITFHSLEDRIVKNYFRSLSKDCICPLEQPICICGGKPHAQLLTKKPVCPTEFEVEQNSPSRSAKLRVIRKLKEISPQAAKIIEPECRGSFL